MNKAQLDEWTTKLGKAWVSLDADAALELVSRNTVEWYESPFSEALTTWQQVHDTWRNDLSLQKDVSFAHQVLACDDVQGLVRWQAELTRIPNDEVVSMDGIFLITLDDHNLCTNFMMWIETK